MIEERPNGEWNHANWQAEIVEFFPSRRLEWNIRVATELRVQVSDGNYRVPDVTLTDPNLPIEQVITRPPIAVLEVLSPEDTLTRTMIEFADCERMGIQTILALDPNGQHFHFSAGKLEPLFVTTIDLPGKRLPLRSGGD